VLAGFDSGASASEEARNSGGSLECTLLVGHVFDRQASATAGDKNVGRIEGEVQTADGQSAAEVNVTLRAVEDPGEARAVER